MNFAKDFILDWENLKTYVRIRHDICIALSLALSINTLYIQFIAM